jgi:hypothetical protein
MTLNPRRIAAAGLAVLLIIGVAYGIISSARDALGPSAVGVHGLIGSEITRLEAAYSGQGVSSPSSLDSLDSPSP